MGSSFRTIRIRGMLLAAIFLVAVSARAGEFFIAPPPLGDDANAGSEAAPFATIAAGVAAAADGDTVTILNGTYTGAGNCPVAVEKAVTIRGKNGAANAIIDCELTQAGFVIQTAAANGAQIEGVTILHANYSLAPNLSFGGIAIIGCAVTVRGVVVDGAAVAIPVEPALFYGVPFDAKGGGISVVDGADATLEDCIVRNCSSKGTPSPNGTLSAGSGYGGGLGVRDASVHAVRCQFLDNAAYGGGGMFTASLKGGYGGGIAVVETGATEGAASRTALFEDCVIQGNKTYSGAATTGDADGAGIYLEGVYFPAEYAPNVTLTRCDVLNNIAAPDSAGYPSGAAIAADWTGTKLTLQDCRIEGNAAGTSVDTPPLVCHFGTRVTGVEPITVTIERSLFAGNHDAGPVFLAGESVVMTLRNSTIAGNSPNAMNNYPAVLLAGASAGYPQPQVTIQHCTIADNTGSAPNIGIEGVIVASGANLVSLRNCILARNIINVNASIQTGGGNILDDETLAAPLASDKTNTNPMLAASLADNGGRTRTLALLAGSPAIDSAINMVNAPTVDQRGLPRPWDGDAVGGAVSDRGAFEYGSTLYNGRAVGDFDDSRCTEIGDFLFLLDNWLMVSSIGGDPIGITDFLALLDNWNLGSTCP